jgi:5-methylcytosine-specific restriction endonuclease McrA
VEHRTLVLTNWFFPYQILSWQDAVTQVYTGDATVVAEYDSELRSPSVTWKCPAVIRLASSFKPKRKTKFSRFNVFTRDKFTCQYCCQKKRMSELTYDHMVPRKRGGKTTWTNIVTACKPCNSRKGSKTCDEAGMFPRTLPVRPKSLPLVSPVRDLSRAPVEWHDFVKPYLPAYS